MTEHYKMENSGSPHAKSISSPRSRSSSPTRPSAWSQTYQVINDIVADAPLGKVVNKSLIGFYFVFALWLIWRLLSLSDNWTQSKRTPSQGEATLHNYFSNFEGYSECGIRAAELYSPPPQDERGFYEYGTFCHDRKHLLEALSEGGRIGFDTPYKARGMILDHRANTITNAHQAVTIAGFIQLRFATFLLVSTPSSSLETTLYSRSMPA